MADKRKNHMSAEEVQPTWEKLVVLEKKLWKNLRLSRVIKPVGTLIFALNLLLATGNFALFLGGIVERYFRAMPVLPALVENLPRGSWGGILAFSLLFIFLVPLAVSGIIFGIFCLAGRKETLTIPLLPDDEAERAKALVYKAEEVYELRKRITQWSAYPCASILTGLMAVPILIACMGFAAGDSPAVLELALGCLALLLCIFVLFWVYALLFKVFALLNALYFLSPGEWNLYQQYHHLDAYWESVDPREFARRQREAAQSKKRRKKEAPFPDEDEEEDDMEEPVEDEAYPEEAPGEN